MAQYRIEEVVKFGVQLAAAMESLQFVEDDLIAMKEAQVEERKEGKSRADRRAIEKQDELGKFRRRLAKLKEDGFAFSSGLIKGNSRESKYADSAIELLHDLTELVDWSARDKAAELERVRETYLAAGADRKKD